MSNVPPKDPRLDSMSKGLKKAWGGLDHPPFSWRLAQYQKRRSVGAAEVKQASALTNDLARENPPSYAAPSHQGTMELLAAMYSENTEHGRHTEAERSTVTSFVLAASAAITVFVCAKDFPIQFWFVPLAVPLLGAYGFVMSWKLYERWEFHMRRARAFRRRLQALNRPARVGWLRESTRIEQRLEYPLLEGLPLHRLWIYLNAGIFVLGVALSIYVPYVRTHIPPDKPTATGTASPTPTAKPASRSMPTP